MGTKSNPILEICICAECNKEQTGFLIPDGRFICPHCSPPAVYNRWLDEWEELERQREKEAARVQKQREKRARAQSREKSAKHKEEVGREEREKRKVQKEKIRVAKEKHVQKERYREEVKPLHDRVADIDVRWVRWTQGLASVLSIFAFIFAVLATVIGVGYFLRFLESNPEPSSEWWIAVGGTWAWILLNWAVAFIVFGQYQICKAVRGVVHALQVPIRFEDLEES